MCKSNHIKLPLFLYLVLFFGAFTFPSLLLANGKESTKSAVYSYHAKQVYGKIGYFKGQAYDNPSDNIFSITLDKQLNPFQEVYLVYEVKGVADASSLSRSINDRLSMGGYVIKKDDHWNLQREKINAEWLTKGENRIQFSTVSPHLQVGYEIRNLRIEISESTSSNPLELAQDVVTVRDDKAYLKGFVRDSSIDKLIVGSQEIPVISGEFESILSLKDKQAVIILAQTKSGKQISQPISLKTKEKADFVFSIVNQGNAFVSRVLNTGNHAVLSQGKATLEIPSKSIDKQKNISITSLQFKDLPALEQGMVNVTLGDEGYRFLPHGEHFLSHPAQVKIKVDKHKLPDGYTLSDVKTYYFDNETKHWKALERDSIDYVNHVIVSKTTHFTDMINGVIKAPESPETSGYAPTMMSDIKAADPSAGINLIPAPSLNNQGSANTSYPIEIPSGRGGVQPSLAVSYSSDNGNSWIGMGWNIPMQSITIDQRWGVPRYNKDLETETYLLNESMLAGEENGKPFVSHRGNPVSRRVDRRFYERIEGNFSKIVRKGDSPQTYYWIVTDKSGTKYYYGGVNKLNPEAVLQDPKTGNVAEWYLTKIEDVDGNSVDYTYEVLRTPAFKNSSIIATNVYPKTINYTGFKGEKGIYTIEFEHSKDSRVDNSNSARYGFFTNNPKLLGKIVIKYQDELIRSYGFTYTDGAFAKKLLQRITQYKGDGSEFTHHDFEYYKDYDSKGELFKDTEVNYNTHDDRLKTGLVSSVVGFNDEVTGLGGNKSKSKGISTSISVGPNNGEVSKSLTAGASFDYSSSTSESLSALVDINGDGMPDKVFIKSGVMYYRPNTSKSEKRKVYFEDKDISQLSFGEPIAIEGAPRHFSYIKSSSRSFGPAVYPKIKNTTVSAGVSINSGRSTTKTYFADVNGDGLIDIVNNGKVYFNSIKISKNASGQEILVPVFTLDSNNTPSPIIGGGKIDTSVYVIDPSEQEELIKQSPLHDMVRVWEAPFSGNVSVESIAKLIVPKDGFDEEEYNKADGVYIQIQHQDKVVFPATKIEKASEATANVGKLSVQKGDKIFFRLQSGQDNNTSNGAFDNVIWNPEISYTAFENKDEVEANGLKSYVYKASEGFVVEKDIPNIVIQNKGEKGGVIISGHLTKPKTTDDVKIIIKSSTTAEGDYKVVWCKNFSASENYNQELKASFELPSTNEAVHYVKIQFISSSNVDWKSIKWDAELKHYKQGDYTISEKKKDPDTSFLDRSKYIMLFTPRKKETVHLNSGGSVAYLEDQVKEADLFQKLDSIKLRFFKPSALIDHGGDIKSVRIRSSIKDTLATTGSFIYRNSEKSVWEYSFHDPVYIFAGKFSNKYLFIKFSQWYQPKEWGGLPQGQGFIDYRNPDKGYNRYFNLWNALDQKLPEVFNNLELVVIVISRSTGFRVYKSDGSYVNITAKDNFGGTNNFGYPYLSGSPRGPGSEEFTLIGDEEGAELFGIGAIRNHPLRLSPSPIEVIEKEIDNFIKYTGIFHDNSNGTNDVISSCNNSEIELKNGVKEDFTSIPVQDYSIYTDELGVGNSFTATASENTTIKTEGKISVPGGVSGEKTLNVTVKKDHSLVAKKQLKITIPAGATSINLT